MEFASTRDYRQLRALRLHFQRRQRGFFRTYRFWIYVLVIAAALDAMSTTHFMLLLGEDKEVHPQIWVVAKCFGPIYGPIFGKIGQVGIGLVAVIWCRKYARLLLGLAAMFYFYAAFHNIFFL